MESSSSSSSSCKEREGAEFRCVQCGFPLTTLYIQYSPGNIRLVKCVNCKEIADEYIECEIMILIIDLILHKPKAYRHLFYNMFSPETLNSKALFWKIALGFALLDTYRNFVLSTSGKDWIAQQASFASFLWKFGKMFAGIFFGNIAVVCVILISSRKFLNAVVRDAGYLSMLLGILVSSYFKVFLLFMMVWEIPPSVVFIVDMFVLSSNTVALNVITYSGMIRCFIICFVGHALKFLVSHGICNYPST